MRLDDRSPPRRLSLTGLFQRLRDDAMSWIQAEVELARTEFEQNARSYLKDSMWLIIAGVIGLLAAMMFVSSVTALVAAGFAAFMPMIFAIACSSSLTGAALAGGAYLTFRTGRKRLKRDELLPKEAIHSFEERAEQIAQNVT